MTRDGTLVPREADRTLANTGGLDREDAVKQPNTGEQPDSRSPRGPHVDPLDLGAQALSSLASHGLLPPRGRLHRAVALVQRIHGQSTVPTRPGLEELREAYWTILEQYLISRLLLEPDEPTDDQLRTMLRFIQKGTPGPAGEKNTRPRDTQFELFVAAMLALGGAKVRLDEPDLRLIHGSDSVGIAAKRVTGRRNLLHRVRHACAQIKRTGAPGFVAVNVDQLVLPSEDVYLLDTRLSEREVAGIRRTINQAPLVQGVLLFWRDARVLDPTTRLFHFSGTVHHETSSADDWVRAYFPPILFTMVERLRGDVWLLPTPPGDSRPTGDDGRRSRADAGDAQAQYELGLIRSRGLDGHQDTTAAAELYQRAADQGHPIAQHNLGFAFATGRGVAVDNLSAYMWFQVAANASHGDIRASSVSSRDVITAMLTAEQVTEAQRRARAWDEAHPRSQDRRTP